jgi:hypothetical protein
MLEEMKLKDVIELVNLLQGNPAFGSMKTKEDGRYVIARTYSAGVFAGELQSKNGKEVLLHNARRLWKWAGAASLSQLAMEGVKDPDNCMFPCEVDVVELTEVIEILNCTDKAKKSVKSVKVWEK